MDSTAGELDGEGDVRAPRRPLKGVREGVGVGEAETEAERREES